MSHKREHPKNPTTPAQVRLVARYRRRGFPRAHAKAMAFHETGPKPMVQSDKLWKEFFKSKETGYGF